MQGVVTCATGT